MKEIIKKIKTECRNFISIIFVCILRFRGIHFFYFVEPMLAELDNMDAYEEELKRLIDGKKCGNVLSDDWIARNDNNKFPRWMDRLKIVYGEKYSEEYIDEFYRMRSVRTFIKNGIPYRVGNSKFVNYQDGHRKVVGQPSDYERKVLLLGKSTILGARLEDKDTVPSQLQKLFNDSDANACVTEYSIGSAKVSLLVKAAMKTVLKRGDCVLLYHADSMVLRTFFKLTGGYYNLKKLVFDNRHEWKGDSELFFDHIHYNKVAAGRIALKAYEILNNKGYCEHQGVVRSYLDEIPYGDDLRSTLKDLKEQYALKEYKERIGAIVMNCNPFTKGHEFLINSAIDDTDFLYVFIVEENKSFFDYEDRIRLVKEAYKDKKDRICVLGSGKFMISKETFPEYFDKERLQEAQIDPTFDLDVFSRYVAPTLNISVRYVGTEPNDMVTNQYNVLMHKILSENGLEVKEIRRTEHMGKAISASSVRKLMQDNRFDLIKELVPDVTYEYLKNRKENNSI